MQPKTAKPNKMPNSKPLAGPKRATVPSDKPGKTYIYRKDAFKKVLIT